MSVVVLHFIPRPEGRGNKLQQLPHPKLMLQSSSCPIGLFVDNDFFSASGVFCVKKHGLGTYTVSLALFFVLLLFKTFLPPLEDILFLKP